MADFSLKVGRVDPRFSVRLFEQVVTPAGDPAEVVASRRTGGLAVDEHAQQQADVRLVVQLMNRGSGTDDLTQLKAFTTFSNVFPIRTLHTLDTFQCWPATTQNFAQKMQKLIETILAGRV